MKDFCSNCPLRGAGTGDPVFCESHPGDKYLIIGEAPGTHECQEGRPFVGPSGRELQLALEAVGIRRDECRITNVIGCRPPGNDLSRALLDIRKYNKRRAKDSQERVSPVTACHDRLWKEINESGIKDIICLGKTAANAIRGGASSIMAIRGGCEEIPHLGLKVAYTIHPAFVLRRAGWREVFQGDLAKAKRFFEGKLQWVDPEIILSGDPEVIHSTFQKFAQEKKAVAYDVETNHINPLRARMRCVAFSNGDTALCIPIEAIDGRPMLAQPKEVKGLISSFLTQPPVPLTGHNAGQYDHLSVWANLGCQAKLTLDTMVLHLLADNELPHNLGFCGSVYTDNIEAWKADHTATQAQTDKELHIYCAKDAAITARIAPRIAKEVWGRGQNHLLPREHMLQQLGTLMQANGLQIDLQRVRQHELRLLQQLEKSRVSCLAVLGKDFNPRSTAQLGKLLFEDWRLPPHHYSEKTGEPSTDDDTLRLMLTHYSLSDEQRQVISAIRKNRKASKILGTYIRPLRRYDEIYTSPSGTKREGIIDASGRIHSSYNRLPATGRYSSSSPNTQNWTYEIRDIVVARPGYRLIGADMDQLEYRVIAEEAEAKHSLKWINDGLDPHNETMEIVYGPGVWETEGAPDHRTKKGKGAFKATRDITKNVRYAWQYAASAKRIHEQIVSVEDGDGNLPYAHMEIEDVRQVVAGLKRADPEIPNWWRRMENLFRRQGFLADTLWGRRRDFKHEDKINELVNHPIQSGGVHIVHEAMIELFYGNQSWFATEALEPVERVLPFPYLISHGHDALYLEVPEEEAEEISQLLQRVMTRRRKEGALLTYTAESSIGDRWSEV